VPMVNAFVVASRARAKTIQLNNMLLTRLAHHGDTKDIDKALKG